MGQNQVITIQEGLTKGLRRDSRNPRNTEAFTVFKNMKPTEFGAREYSDLTDGATNGPLIGDTTLTYAWPWPQVFRGKSVIVAAENQDIYYPTFTSDAWLGVTVATDKLIIKQALAVGDNYVIPTTSGEEGIWHFVDFGEVWALVRPNCTIFKGKHRETSGGDADAILGQGSDDAAYVSMRTACDYKDGRAFAGGFDGDHFWGTDWQQIWRTWAAQQQIGVDFDFTEVGSNWVMWSAPGGSDLLWIFYPSYAYNPSGVLATYTPQAAPAEPILFTALREKTIGMMPMPWSGDVEVLKQLGDAVMVYGSNGISALVPVENATTFAVRRIFDHVGVVGRGSVGGNKSVHVFITGPNKELWMIGPDLQPKRLGYSEFLAYESIISYDELQGDFYICNDTNGTGILTRSGGFCTVGQKINSVFYSSVELVAAFENITEAETQYAQMKSDVMDMGTRAYKNINLVELGGEWDDASDVTVSIFYRYDTTGAFSETTDIIVSNEGLAVFNVSGVEFYVSVQAEDHTDIMNMDYVKIHYSIADERHVRGQNNG